VQLKRPVFHRANHAKRINVSRINLGRLGDGDGNVGETRAGTYDNAKISYSRDAVKLFLEDERKQREDAPANIDGEESHGDTNDLSSLVDFYELRSVKENDRSSCLLHSHELGDTYIRPAQMSTPDAMPQKSRKGWLFPWTLIPCMYVRVNNVSVCKQLPREPVQAGG